MSQAPIRRILLVEDNHQLLAILSTFLRRVGYDVTQACSSGTALVAFNDAQAAPDLVITDINLGDGSGFELARILRQTNPRQPVLFMSGDIDSRPAIGALGWADTGYLMKPFSLVDLEFAVRTALCPAKLVSSMQSVGTPGDNGSAPERVWGNLNTSLMQLADRAQTPAGVAQIA